ncbi:MAG: 3-dehydroquinate synthase [Acidobacteriales bacterium]|nr:3-dehydroquinate synthase [Terriglobales bacterium]
MNCVTVQVKPEAYEVLIENGLLRQAGARMLAGFDRKPSLISVVTVAPVRKHWESTLLASLKDARLEAHVVEMRDGERYKTLSSLEELAGKLVKRGADRHSAVVAFGGGVVGDVAGLLASVYMRGVSFAQVPTTFLAQVDAAIGGKTGVNMPVGKNLLGTFYQPRTVLVDPEVLATLPEREYRSGLYEALKCGIIRNREVFDFMQQERERILRRDADALKWLITECVKIKAEVVAADEREGDLRRILNFGHTIGHALEAETAYRQFLHGEAVAWGMVAASMIAAGMQKTSSETAQRIISAVLAYAPLPRVEARSKSIARRVLSDKKTVDGITHFILPREIGHVEIVRNVPDRAVLQAIEELRYLSRV